MQDPGTWYHVFNRGSRRQATIFDRRDARLFLGLLEEAASKFEIEVHAYCLMGNHYHLLVHSPVSRPAAPMQWLISLYTRAFNERRGFDGPLFKGRYKALVIEEVRHLLAISRYIHRNPIEAGLTDDLPEYEHSSYRSYIGHVVRPEWLTVDATLSQLGGYQKRYRALVEDLDVTEKWLPGSGWAIEHHNLESGLDLAS